MYLPIVVRASLVKIWLGGYVYKGKCPIFNTLHGLTWGVGFYAMGGGYWFFCISKGVDAELALRKLELKQTKTPAEEAKNEKPF